MRILIVDDETMQLKSLKLGLRTEGHTIVTALSGEEALEVLKADPQPFELLLTDYLMNGMNGLELLKAVRQRSSFLPVILMTAYGKKDLIIEALHNECNGCIEKPFSLDELVTEIARVEKLAKRRSIPRDLDKSLAHIVHQINNPLAAIIGSASLALTSPPDPEANKQRLETIISASDQIIEINRTILNLGKDKIPPRQLAKIDIKQLLNDCLTMFESLATQRGITLQKTMADDEILILGERFELQQVFRNLLMNSIEAMDGCSEKLLTVTIVKESDGGESWIAVHIADTGCGVPEERCAEFFKSTTTTKKNGSGIGLQVVKEMVIRHHGEMQIESREGLGTVITVRLPAGGRNLTVSTGDHMGTTLPTNQSTDSPVQQDLFKRD